MDSLLSSVVEKYGSDRYIEIECRRRINNRKDFSVINSFLQLKLGIADAKYTKSEIHDNGLRVNNSVETIRKTVLRTESCDGWKIAVSEERVLRDRPRSRPKFTRHKLRESYRDKGLRIDMTTVTVDEHVNYEMELEVIRPEGVVPVILSYIALVPLILSTPGLQNPRLNVVRNLKRRMITDPTSPDYVPEFILTPKWNGVRYFLHAIDGKLYISNATSTFDYSLLFNNIEIDKSASFVLDGEVFNGNYIAFDCVINKRVDIGATMGRMDRMKVLSEVVAEYRLPIRIAEYCEEGKVLALDYYELRFGGMDMDGYLIIERDSLYNNHRTYKFKPVDMLTIDFKPKRRVDAGGMVYYELYCNGPGNTDVLFKGTDAYPFDGCIRKLMIKERDMLSKPNSIVEFKWFCGRFVPVRYRGDKTKPNFINICKDVWEDINNPLTFHQFRLDLFQRDYPKVWKTIQDVCKIDKGLDVDAAVEMWLNSMREALPSDLPSGLRAFVRAVRK